MDDVFATSKIPIQSTILAENFSEHDVSQLRYIRKVETRLVRDGNFSYQGSALTEPEQFVAAFNKITQHDNEVGITLFLDTRNMPIGYDFWKGGIDYVALDPRQIFKEMALLNASKIVFLHNHPEGDHRPSGMDTAFCIQLNSLCTLMGWEVADFIVLSETGYYSFKKENDPALPQRTISQGWRT
jgi:DNA repair protein RadC